MRHGRKSRSRVINGYKRHIAREVESSLILAATVRPANEPEHKAADLLRPDILMFGEVDEFHIDLGYLASRWTQELYETGKRILAKPWPVRNGNCFPKTAFIIDLKKNSVQCPEGWTAPIGEASVARFKAAVCDVCPSRQQCTRAAAGRGRSITVHPQEAMLLGLRALTRTSQGRQALRQRVAVEHSLAHLVRRQGPRARYWGLRKNTLDIRRVAAVENLHTLDRLKRAA